MRPQRWTGLILVAPLGFLLWGCFLIYHRASPYAVIASQLPNERAAAKREDVPMTREDMLRIPPVENARNAAPLYREVSDAMQKLPYTAWDSVRPLLLNQATDQDRKQVRWLLEQCRKVLEQAEKAALLPDCDFQPDWKQGVTLAFPEYASLRQVVRLFSARAILIGEDNQPQEALRSLLIAARIARHIGQGPCTASLQTALNLENSIERPLIRIVQRYGARMEVLQQAREVEEILDTPLDIGRALRGDCVLRFQTLARLRSNDSASLTNGFPPPYPQHASHQVALDAWEVRCIAYWRRLFSRIRQVAGDDEEVYRAVKAVNEEEQLALLNEKQRINPSYELNLPLEPDYTETAQQRVFFEAKHRLRRTQLTLFADRIRIGRFPDHLEQLPVPPEVDPFAHQPLHYRKTETGFLLYSVGVNLADDNGDGVPRSLGSYPPDIAITYPAPKQGIFRAPRAIK